MKVSYLTTYDATDVHKWSGLGYFIAKAIKDQGVEIDFVGNLEPQNAPKFYINKILAKLTGKHFIPARTPAYAKLISTEAEKRISSDSDIAFAPGTPAICFLKTNKLKVFYTDATFAGMLGFYKDFSNLSSITIRNGNDMEQKALDNCDLAIYSSEWAADSARKFYKVNPDKIKVVPFGANIFKVKPINEIKEIIEKKPKDECHLLFMGVDWDRKGGDTAINIAKCLNEMGLKTYLHLSGLNELPVSNLPEYVINHGFLSKESADGQKKIDELFSISHFFVLPTKADCTPLVCSEANAFGLPCITTNVGGIPSLIEDNVNGKMFNSGDSAQLYADYIYASMQDQKHYAEFSISSYEYYLKNLNWDVTGKKLVEILKQAMLK